MLAKRRLNSVPIIFKGSGWYVTDYGRRNSPSTGNGVEESGSSEAKEKSKTTEAPKAEESKAGEES